MKKIANFTQTYKVIQEFTWGADGVDREYLIDFMIKDENQIKLRKLLDLHTFNFHNYKKEETNSIRKKITSKIPTVYNLYSNCTYGYSFIKHIEYLKSEGITDILWIQDDEFCIHDNFDDIKDIFEFYKSREDIKCICLRLPKSDIDKVLSATSDDIGEDINNNIKIFKTNSQDINTYDRHGFPSGGLLCDIDIIYSMLISTDGLSSTTNAYNLERIMCDYGTAHKIQRCVLSHPIIKVFNISGMGGSLGDAQECLETLNAKFNMDLKLEDINKNNL
jgi:hypothetical protein